MPRAFRQADGSMVFAPKARQLFTTKGITEASLWKTLVATHGARIQSDAVKQQFDCHVEGGIVGGSFNDDTWAPEFDATSNPG